MKYKIYILFSLLLLISSCTFPDEENIYENKLQVGYIYCSDGSVIHPDAFTNSQKEAVGVVFWINEKKGENNIGYAVALTDIGKDYLINSDEDLGGVTENENDFKGASNTSAYIDRAVNDTLVTIPGIKRAVNYAPKGVTGWFIPSAGQAKFLVSNNATISESFSKVNGIPFDGWYWTSTEDGNGEKSPIFFGLVISLNEGRITNSRKKIKYNIRPIIAIR